jgi:malonyl-CoA decarboxylase
MSSALPVASRAAPSADPASNLATSALGDAPRSPTSGLLGAFRRQVQHWIVGAADAVAAPDAQKAWQRDLEACAREQGGPVAARARARDMIAAYHAMDEAAQLDALKAFAALRPAMDPLGRAFFDYRARLGSDGEWAAENTLRESLITPRSRVIRLFGAAHGGVRFLVALRAQVLGLIKAHPMLTVLEDELLRELTAWFDVGFLELKRIDWNSPANILEKLMAYEAVHEIASWADMKNRLDQDRRIYAFFHPRLKDEPLVFVEVALTEEIAGNVQVLLDQAAPVTDVKRARAAMFYSISSTQNGLRGISFGNFLIKRVVEDLKRDFPKLSHFATLSPIPGFAAWLAKTNYVPQALREALAKPWDQDAGLSSAMRAPLMGLAAHYLMSVAKDGRPQDPVARFHLGNGARIERLNWLADQSAKGFKQSHALMVNYLYELDDIEANIEAFEAEGTIPANGRVKRLATVAERMLATERGSADIPAAKQVSGREARKAAE